MEVYEQHSSSEPQIHDEQQLGLQFSRDPNGDIPPPDDGIKKIVAQLHHLSLKKVVNGEVIDDEEIKLKHAFDEELYHLTVKQAISEALQDESLKRAIDREIAASEALSDGLPDHNLRRFISEALEINLEKTDTEVKYEVQIDNYESDKGEFENRESNGWDEYIEECEGYNLNHHGGEDSETALDERQRTYNYPLRPDAEDCSFYLKTGTCKYGSNCKYNHPLRRRNQGPQATMEMVRQREESSERPLQIECKYYLTSGCKYGKACRYRHSKAIPAVAPTVEFNFLGLPIRRGEKECPYYMRTGSCKYGSNCRFNHPDPTAAIGGETQTPSRYNNNGGSPSLQNAPQTMPSWQSPRAMNETTPYVPVMYPPTQSLRPPTRDWNSYQAPVYTSSETGLPTPPAFAMNNSATDATTAFYPRHQPPMMPFEEYPERPGEPECTYFLKTGDCKYRSNCRFHHPKNRIPKAPPCTLSDKGLPLRPGQNTCTHYSRYGICKFGPACKYDHPPVNHSNSTGYEPDEPSFGTGS